MAQLKDDCFAFGDQLMLLKDALRSLSRRLDVVASRHPGDTRELGHSERIWRAELTSSILSSTGTTSKSIPGGSTCHVQGQHC